MFKFLVIGLFLYACGVTAQKPTVSQVYDDCGKGGKKCWGDKEGCIEARQCTYAISVSENTTHYNVLMVNGCAEPKKSSKDFYIGVGYDTLDAEGVRKCRDPSIDDFKGFIFWKDHVKCAAGRTYAYELFWTSRNKNNLKQMCLYDKSVHGEKIEGRFNLTNYLQKYVILKAGDDTYPYTFADKVDYKYDDGLYINRHPATVEPEDPKIPITANTKPTYPQPPSGSSSSYHGSTDEAAAGGSPSMRPSTAAEKITPAQVYDNCGKPGKRCWGDVEGCLDSRTCAFAIAVWENTTDYSIAVLNNCGEPNRTSKDYFMGVGFDMLNGDGYTICRDPNIQDFKAFILWDKQKCPVKTFYQVYWTFRNKNILKRICEQDEAFGRNRRPEGKFHLQNYLRKYIIISDGDDKYPFAFADKADYKYTNDLYINRQAAPSEPGDPVEPETRALSSYHGNATDSNGASRSTMVPSRSMALVTMFSIALTIFFANYL